METLNGEIERGHYPVSEEESMRQLQNLSKQRKGVRDEIGRMFYSEIISKLEEAVLRCPLVVLGNRSDVNLTPMQVELYYYIAMFSFFLMQLMVPIEEFRRGRTKILIVPLIAQKKNWISGIETLEKHFGEELEEETKRKVTHAKKTLKIEIEKLSEIWESDSQQTGNFEPSTLTEIKDGFSSTEFLLSDLERVVVRGISTLCWVLKDNRQKDAHEMAGRTLEVLVLVHQYVEFHYHIAGNGNEPSFQRRIDEKWWIKRDGEYDYNDFKRIIKRFSTDFYMASEKQNEAEKRILESPTQREHEEPINLTVKGWIVCYKAFLACDGQLRKRSSMIHRIRTDAMRLFDSGENAGALTHFKEGMKSGKFGAEGVISNLFIWRGGISELKDGYDPFFFSMAAMCLMLQKKYEEALEVANKGYEMAIYDGQRMDNWRKGMGKFYVSLNEILFVRIEVLVRLHTKGESIECSAVTNLICALEDELKGKYVNFDGHKYAKKMPVRFIRRWEKFRQFVKEKVLCEDCGVKWKRKGRKCGCMKAGFLD